MKKKLMLMSLVAGVFTSQYTVLATEDDNASKADTETVSSGDSKSTSVSVGFYIAEEDKGVQFIKDDDGTPIIKNYEGFGIQITNKDTGEVNNFSRNDGLVVSFELDPEFSYSVVISMVVDND